MGADSSSKVKSILTWVLAFYAHYNLGLGRVINGAFFAMVFCFLGSFGRQGPPLNMASNHNPYS